MNKSACTFKWIEPVSFFVCYLFHESTKDLILTVWENWLGYLVCIVVVVLRELQQQHSQNAYLGIVTDRHILKQQYTFYISKQKVQE